MKILFKNGKEVDAPRETAREIARNLSSTGPTYIYLTGDDDNKFRGIIKTSEIVAIYDDRT